MLRIIDSLGALGGARISQLGPIDAAALVAEVVDYLRLRDRFVVETQIGGSSEHPDLVYGNGALLALALRLLLRNAAQILPDGAALGVRTSLRSGAIRLTVWDAGPGVPPELRPLLFSRPFSTKGGEGVGLLLVRLILESTHHGRVAFAPNSPRGSQFHLDLPLPELRPVIHEGAS
jgi:signal transduction histidine kinase